MTGFLLCHNYGFLYRKNTKIPIGICYRTAGTLGLLMRTSTELTSLSPLANLLTFLLSWTGARQGGIQVIGNIVKHSTPAAPRMKKICRMTYRNNSRRQSCTSSGSFPKDVV